MRRINLKSAHATKKQIDDHLACERRPRVRRRLEAVRKILEGKTPAQAAYATGSSDSSVERWLRMVRRSGCAALLVDRRGRPPAPAPTPPQVRATREEIAAALKRRPEWRLRLRLIAIALALSGKMGEAADRAHVRPRTVKDWLHLLRRIGIVKALES
jgi:transposase